MSLPHPLRHLRQARATRAEVDAVPDSEIEAWGLSRDEFRDVALIPPHRLHRMEQMAEVHGATRRLESDPEARIQAALACSRCRDLRLCGLMLEDGAEAGEMDFCPNHEAFEALAAGR